jgi:PEP-CTERM motif
MIKRLMAAFAFAAVVSTPVSGAIIYGTGGVTTDIPGLTGFMTTGSMMDGMQVRACFSGPIGCEVRPWTDIVSGSGGVTGTGWSLSLTGDTFTADWRFDFTSTDLGQLLSLLLDGRGALTIFDRTRLASDPGGIEGTPGSAQGRDWTSGLGATTTINVTFLDPTTVGGVLHADDLFQQVSVDFGDTGPRVDFVFQQDTDNDSRLRVPEPSTLLLLGLGMLAFAGVHRRRV